MKFEIKLNNNTFYYFTNCLCFFTIMLGTINSSTFCGLEISAIQTVARYITFFLFLLIFAKKNARAIKLNRLLLTVIVIGIIGAVYAKIDDAVMIITLMSILAGKNIDAKKMSLHMYRIIFAFIVFVVFLCLIGLLPDVFVARSGSLRAGHSLGFLGANAFASNVFTGLIYYMYANKDQWRMRQYTFCILATVVTFMVTKSRMTCMLEVITIFLIWIVRRHNSGSIIYTIQKYIFSGAAVLTLVLTKWYMGNPMGIIQNVLNLFTTGRLYWISYFLEENGLSLLGKPIDLVGSKMAALTGGRWQSIDNAYGMLAIHYGVILLLLLCIGYIYLGNYLRNKRNYIGAVLTIILAIWGLTENNIITIGYNLSFYLMAEMLWKRENWLNYLRTLNPNRSMS